MMLNENKRYLGIDWGGKRVGLALAEGEVKIASPWKTVSGMEEVLEAVENEEVDVVVVGVPFKVHGRDKEVDPEFQEFLRKLRENIKAEVVTVDERLSSKSADALDQGGHGKTERDAVAAMVILQQYLDNIDIGY